MTHSHVRHDSSTCETWLIYTWDMTYSHDSFRCETWLNHMTHPGVRHDSFRCETWLIHMWDMTESHDSFKCETWLIQIWDMTQSLVRHDLFTPETWLTWLIHMTHSDVRHDSFTCESRLTERSKYPPPRAVHPRSRQKLVATQHREISPTKFLKYQLDSNFTLAHLVPRWLLKISFGKKKKNENPWMDRVSVDKNSSLHSSTKWVQPNFSTVSSIVILHSTSSSELTFEKFFRVQHHKMSAANGLVCCDVL